MSASGKSTKRCVSPSTEKMIDGLLPEDLDENKKNFPLTFTEFCIATNLRELARDTIKKLKPNNYAIYLNHERCMLAQEYLIYKKFYKSNEARKLEPVSLIRIKDDCSEETRKIIMLFSKPTNCEREENLLNYPVTFEEFCKFTNCSKVTDEKVRKSGEKLRLEITETIRNSEIWKNIARKLYKNFYTSEEKRKKDGLKVNSCPKCIKLRLLQFANNKTNSAQDIAEVIKKYQTPINTDIPQTEKTCLKQIKNFTQHDVQRVGDNLELKGKKNFPQTEVETATKMPQQKNKPHLETEERNIRTKNRSFEVEDDIEIELTLSPTQTETNMEVDNALDKLQSKSSSHLETEVINKSPEIEKETSPKPPRTETNIEVDKEIILQKKCEQSSHRPHVEDGIEIDTTPNLQPVETHMEIDNGKNSPQFERDLHLEIVSVPEVEGGTEKETLQNLSQNEMQINYETAETTEPIEDIENEISIPLLESINLSQFKNTSHVEPENQATPSTLKHTQPTLVTDEDDGEAAKEINEDTFPVSYDTFLLHTNILKLAKKLAGKEENSPEYNLKVLIITRGLFHEFYTAPRYKNKIFRDLFVRYDYIDLIMSQASENPQGDTTETVNRNDRNQPIIQSVEILPQFIIKQQNKEREQIDSINPRELLNINEVISPQQHQVLDELIEQLQVEEEDEDREQTPEEENDERTPEKEGVLTDKNRNIQMDKEQFCRNEQIPNVVIEKITQPFESFSSTWTFPVSFQTFCKHTHYKKILHKVLNKHCQENSTEWQKMAHEIYENFYKSSEKRQEYDIELKPIPQIIRNKLLQFATEDSNDSKSSVISIPRQSMDSESEENFNNELNSTVIDKSSQSPQITTKKSKQGNYLQNFTLANKKRKLHNRNSTEEKLQNNEETLMNSSKNTQECEIDKMLNRMFNSPVEELRSHENPSETEIISSGSTHSSGETLHPHQTIPTGAMFHKNSPERVGLFTQIQSQSLLEPTLERITNKEQKYQASSTADLQSILSNLKEVNIKTEDDGNNKKFVPLKNMQFILNSSSSFEVYSTENELISIDDSENFIEEGISNILDNLKGSSDHVNLTKLDSDISDTTVTESQPLQISLENNQPTIIDDKNSQEKNIPETSKKVSNIVPTTTTNVRQTQNCIKKYFTKPKTSTEYVPQLTHVIRPLPTTTLQIQKKSNT